MRSNGLTAASYAPVADLDPQTAEAMLNQLKGYGIAAYCTPVARSATAEFERPQFNSDVHDRLYVDAAATVEAQQILSDLDVETAGESEDLAWAQIVAGYDRPVDAPISPWPVAEDLTEPTASEHDSNGSDRWWAAPPTPTPSWDAEDTAKRRAPDEPRLADDDDRFVPPTPPPIPRPQGPQRLAWLAAVGGPAVLLIAAIFTIRVPTWLTMVAAVAFVGGFVALVAMMDNDRDPEDPDDGAQV